MSKKQIAIILMLFSTLSFSVMQLIVKISAGAIPTMEQVFTRNFVTLFVGFLMAVKNHDPLMGSRENRLLLLGRSLFGYLGIVGYFYATSNMNVADASLLHRSSPFFVILFSAVFLKNKMTRHQIIALLMAFAGSVLVINPSFNSNLLPALAGAFSAASAGAAYVLINVLKGKEKNSTIIFVFSLFSCICSVLVGGSTFVMPHGVQWLQLAGLGIFAAAGQILLTQAYKMTNPGDVSIINYTGILFSALFGVLFLRESVGLRSACGMACIFAAALLLYFTKDKTAQKKTA